MELNKALKRIYISKPIDSQGMERDTDNVSDMIDSIAYNKLLIGDYIINYLRIEYQDRS